MDGESTAVHGEDTVEDGEDTVEDGEDTAEDGEWKKNQAAHLLMVKKKLKMNNQERSLINQCQRMKRQLKILKI